MNENKQQDILKSKAEKMLRLLIFYAKSDPFVKEALYIVEPFLEKAKKGELTVPQKFPYSWYIFNGEYNIAYYSDLANASGDFIRFVEGR